MLSFLLYKKDFSCIPALLYGLILEENVTRIFISSALLLARICLAAIFLLGGISKFMDYNGTAAYMASYGIPMVPFFLVAAALIEIIGGLSLLLGLKTRWGAGLLLLFLIPVTGILHAFWSAAPGEQAMQMINFFKNLAIFGGLLYVLCWGAGEFSMDACRRYCRLKDEHRP
jgi:putative oxidoreductase